MIIDTSVWIRHLTGDPPGLAARATEFLESRGPFVLPHVVVAECVWVLESVYVLPKSRIAEMMRAALDLAHSLGSVDDRQVTRALALYDSTTLSFVDSYIVAYAESFDAQPVVTFDKGIGKHAGAVEVWDLAS